MINLINILTILAEVDTDRLAKIAIFIAVFVFFVPVFLLTIIVCIKTIIKKRRAYKGIEIPRSKDIKKKTNNEQYENLFGGYENIVSIKKELNRVTLTVKDLDLVQMDKLQDLKIGVLIVGKTIKCSSADFVQYFDEKN